MNEPLAAKSNAKTVWQQDDDHYKPSVVIHGEDGIGIQVGGTVMVKTATQWQDLVNQLADEKQQHKIMDAAYWAAKEQFVEERAERRRWQENCERETRRVVELLEERGRLIMAAEDKDAALAALAGALESISNPDDLREEAAPPLGRTEMQKIAEQALAPDAVQQAVEAPKAKDAEIEQLKANYAALVLEGTDRDDPTSMVSMIEAAEAKLAEAMGLLQDSTEAMAEWRKYRERPGLPSFNRQEANMWAAQQKADAFLADPSQAAAQYHEAQDVVERVKAAINAREALPEKESNPDIALVLQVLRPLLGDAAQEEQP